MSHPSLSTDEPRETGRSPWRAIGVITAVLALLLFAFPTAVVDWVSERCPEGPVCDAAVAAAGAIEDASYAVGVAPAAQSLRETVRAVLGIDAY